MNNLNLNIDFKFMMKMLLIIEMIILEIIQKISRL